MVKVWQIALATLVIYAAGIFTGGMLIKVTNSSTSPSNPAPQVAESKPGEQRPEPRSRRDGEFRERRNQFMDHMAKELSLTSEQRARVEAIIKEGQDRIRNRIDPITKEEFERTHQAMLKELTPEQQLKAEEFRNRMRNPAEKGHDKEKLKKKADDQGQSQPAACNSSFEELLSSVFLSPAPQLCLSSKAKKTAAASCQTLGAE